MSQGKQYKIHWKLAKEKRPETADFLAPSLMELMRMVGRAYNIDTDICEFIYVHEINEKGIPTEVFAFEADAADPNLMDTGTEDEQTKVVNIVQAALNRAAGEREKAPKPHIRLSHDKSVPPRQLVRAAHGRYTAYEAT